MLNVNLIAHRSSAQTESCFSLSHSLLFMIYSSFHALVNESTHTAAVAAAFLCVRMHGKSMSVIFDNPRSRLIIQIDRDLQSYPKSCTTFSNRSISSLSIHYSSYSSIPFRSVRSAYNFFFARFFISIRVDRQQMVEDANNIMRFCLISLWTSGTRVLGLCRKHV